MKEYLKLLFVGGLVFSIMASTSCNNKKSGEVIETTNDNHLDDGHVHDYACPMHPNLRGHQGEKCNACGMAMEMIEVAEIASRYKMDFHASSNEIQTADSVSLIFQPRNIDKPNLAVPLDVTHEKKIHLFVIDETLSWFDHIHPEYLSDGSYLAKESFPTAGKYILFADYKPSGSSEQMERIDLEVFGEPKATTQSNKIKTVGSSGDHSVSLMSLEPSFYANKEIHFNGVITKNGKSYDANELQHFLGSSAHLVAVHAESKSLIHIHSEIENEKLHFHANIPTPGTYRMWLQFQEMGRVHTIDFTLNVVPLEDEKEHESDESVHEH